MTTASSTRASLASVLVFIILGIAQAQSTSRTINVAGTGTASAPPDLATIDTGVVTTAKTAMVALDENNKAFAKVLAVLDAKGIDEKDVQTTFFDVSPQFARGTGGQRGNITGYRVTNEVQVKVRDIDILGDVLDALVTAGSNSISGVSFSIADPKPITNEARKLAVADAKSRAELYATAAGVTLGKIISISEQPISQPQPEAALLSADAASRGVPIATGELDIQATVFILFDIGA